jgi:hypothetical protein
MHRQELVCAVRSAYTAGANMSAQLLTVERDVSYYYMLQVLCLQLHSLCTADRRLVTRSVRYTRSYRQQLQLQLTL